MDNIQWIKDLVVAEQQMEESGVVDISAGFDSEKVLKSETIEFLRDLKAAFVEAATTFNQLKGSNLGNIKIYGISKTKADFMLFRNGYKLIFSMHRPGAIHIYLNLIGNTFLPGSPADEAQQAPKDKEVLKAHWGAFGDLNWAYKEQPIKLDSLVRFYLSKFIRESTK